MRICPLACCVVATSVSLTFGQFNKIEPPPMPDFMTPVDYVGWYYAQFAPTSDSDALPLYEPILFDPKLKSLSVNPRSKAGAELFEILGNPQDWKVTDKPQLASWVNKLEKQYRQPFLDAASKKQMSVRKLPGMEFLHDRPTSNFVNGRAIGQMMFARAWRVEGKQVFTDHLVEATKANLAYAMHLGNLPSLDEQFFAAGHDNMIYTQVLTALRSFVHRQHVWDEISEAFDQFDSVPATQRFARSLYFDEASALQQLQHFCMEGADKVSNATPKIDQAVVDKFYAAPFRLKEKAPAACGNLASADPVQLATDIHNYYEQMRTLLGKTFVTNLKDEIARIEKEHYEGKPGMDCLVRPVGFAVQASFRSEALRRASRLFLEKALDYKRSGVWPRSIDELKNPVVATCRIDPYSGKDLLCRPNQGVEAVYSVGVDGVDDKADGKKDIIIWTRVYTEKQGVAQNPSPAEKPEGTEKPAGKDAGLPVPSKPSSPAPSP